MRLIFQLNQDYVFFHAINAAQYVEPFSGWFDFTNEIWGRDEVVFYFLAGAPEYVLFLNSNDTQSVVERAESELEAVRRSDEYKRLIMETEKYLLFVKSQWQRNRNRSLGFLEKILGATLPERDIVVYVTHPKLRNGMALNESMIVWGHPEDFENYSTVYLCHELMHILTGFDTSDVNHAVIELATDNELRMGLNGRGEYFEHPGHKNLKRLEKKILPYWKKYLRGGDKNIFSFIERMKKRS